MSIESSLLTEVLAALRVAAKVELTLVGEGGLSSAFPVSELATVAIGSAALAAAEYAGSRRVIVDRRLSSAWFATSIRPIGWALPSVWDPIAGDYKTRDSWLRLHTNAPHHKAAALAVLDCDDSSVSVTDAVSTWNGRELEAAIISAGGCAAVMQTIDEWSTSVQGIAVAAEPLVSWRDSDSGRAPQHQGTALRPLRGVRVLDLTRVLAGPIATRFLALLGADVLRVDPPHWNESVLPEVTLGKRTTRLNLHDSVDRATFTTLLHTADVIVHGYRPSALERLGFGEHERQHIRPGLIDIAIDAYGWSGPAADRRGFDSLVQMSTGIADAGMRAAGGNRPVPLPVQALDHATGYFAAGAALSALSHRRETGIGRSARLSLARTAHLLIPRRNEGDHDPFPPLSDLDFQPEHEATSWGPAQRLRQPFSIKGIRLHARPARDLGLDEPRWREQQ